MKVESKKISMAEKMYDQNGTGGKRKKPLYTQNSKGGKGTILHPKMIGHGKGSSERVSMANGSGGFTGKYTEGNGKRNRPMIQGSSKANQKGKGSMNSVKNNTDMYLGKNENNRP